MVQRSPIRIARDYNRGLTPPVRWAHLAWAALARPLLDGLAWCFDPRRRHWAAPILLAATLVPITLPRDRVIHATFAPVFRSLGGDVRREIEAWQQFGGLGSIIFAVVVVLILDRSKARRLPDFALALAATAAATTFFKAFFGRPRPKYDDPWFFSWPGGDYPLAREGHGVLMTAMTPGSRAELWSMPSSHTSSAAALALCIIALYPQLRGVCLALIGVVIVGRTMVGDFPAHWPSDVIAGGCLGWLVSGTIVHHSLGCRLLDRLTSRPKPRPTPSPAPNPARQELAPPPG